MKSLVYFSIVGFSCYFLNGYSGTPDDKADKPVKEEKPAGCGLYDFKCSLEAIVKRPCALYDFKCEQEKKDAEAALAKENAKDKK